MPIITYDTCNTCGARLVKSQADLVNSGVEGFECPTKLARTMSREEFLEKNQANWAKVEEAKEAGRLEAAAREREERTIIREELIAAAQLFREARMREVSLVPAGEGTGRIDLVELVTPPEKPKPSAHQVIAAARRARQMEAGA